MNNCTILMQKTSTSVFKLMLMLISLFFLGACSSQSNHNESEITAGSESIAKTNGGEVCNEVSEIDNEPRSNAALEEKSADTPSDVTPLVVYEDLSSYFGNYDGAFVLYELESGQYTIYNKDKCEERFSPMSTCKMVSALMALEAGVVSADSSARRWDGTMYPFDNWNKDQDIVSALQNSVSWYFQTTDAEVGAEKLGDYYSRLSYGNYDLSGGIEEYWTENSTLRISPMEQIEFLKSFYLNETVFSDETVDTIKDIIRLSEKDGASLSGKTGTGAINNHQVSGWFVGYIEKDSGVQIFALHINGTENAGGLTAEKIAREILGDKEIF